MRSSQLLVVFLLFAAPAQAQHCHSRMQASVGNSSIGSQGTGGGYGSSINSAGSANAGLQYEPPRDYTLGYAKNDGPFVPSTYMDYREALALGRQQLAAGELRAHADTYPPLGDVARAYRTAKLSTPKVPNTPAPEQIVQVESGSPARRQPISRTSR